MSWFPVWHRNQRYNPNTSDARRDPDQRMPIPFIGISAKSIGQDASCGARHHDHVVKILRIRLCFLFNLHRRKRLNPKIKRLIFASWKVKNTPLHT